MVNLMLRMLRCVWKGWGNWSLAAGLKYGLYLFIVGLNYGLYMQTLQ